jgi:hypothetical protein
MLSLHVVKNSGIDTIILYYKAAEIDIFML